MPAYEIGIDENGVNHLTRK